MANFLSFFSFTEIRVLLLWEQARISVLKACHHVFWLYTRIINLPIVVKSSNMEGLFMDHKHKELLSIGEISKVTGINSKSIRYYDRIGVLKPARIDAETGYRHYSLEQIHHLFAIKTCIHFGIPLRKFSKYFQNGTLYASRYLQDASAISMQSIQSLQSKLDFIRNLQAFIHQADQLIAHKRIQNFNLPETTFLIREIPQDLTLHSLLHIYTEMNAIAKPPYSYGLLSCGRIAIFHHGQLEHLYAAVSASHPTDDNRSLTLPAASYASVYSENPAILQAPQIFSGHDSSGQKMIVLETNCIASQYNAASPGYILRCIHL